MESTEYAERMLRPHVGRSADRVPGRCRGGLLGDEYAPAVFCPLLSAACESRHRRRQGMVLHTPSNSGSGISNAFKSVIASLSTPSGLAKDHSRRPEPVNKSASSSLETVAFEPPAFRRTLPLFLGPTPSPRNLSAPAASSRLEVHSAMMAARVVAPSKAVKPDNTGSGATAFFGGAQSVSARAN